MDAAILPKARTTGLLVTRMESGETVVYDRERDRVHCLNPAVAAIWAACDGNTSVAEMAAELHRRHGLPQDESVVALGLQELQQEDLLDGSEAWTGVSRREVLTRLSLGAAAAALLPVVASVVAPTPAEAGTGLPPGSSCTSGYQCLSGICINNQCV